MPDVLDHFVYKQNDSPVVYFRLRKRGTKQFLNVIGATIVLEWSRGGPSGPVTGSITANPGHPEAAWGTGYVPIAISGLDVTAQVATVLAVVRVDLAGQSVALPHDGHVVFEIQPRGELP
jgi:hypothetical protein